MSSLPLLQHRKEVLANQTVWAAKPLLRAVYAKLYARILPHIDAKVPGLVVEIGSGMGNLKTHVPTAICTDLFPGPGIDVVCDGYDLPFGKETVSHLVLFDVFHHLEAPNAFLREARRVLVPGGRIILLDPYISACSQLIYGLFHHEPVAWGTPIRQEDVFQGPRHYYAAQGNTTRLFFRREWAGWPEGWKVSRCEAFAAFAYFLAGGFSRKAFYPLQWMPFVEKVDGGLTRWPKLFGGRCLIVLEKANTLRADGGV
ncbi:MAG: class SAM-dependent methyltransferase [Verrucomicrobia bacterium]|jgi:SAM-dependent methyltransferase|nr:class SAM-dependent methyltransferase [Verrucomicrobiota bacterium]